MRHTGAAADVYDDEGGLENFPVRMNASDLAFTQWGTFNDPDLQADARTFIGQESVLGCAAPRRTPGGQPTPS